MKTPFPLQCSSSSGCEDLRSNLPPVENVLNEYGMTFQQQPVRNWGHDTLGPRAMKRALIDDWARTGDLIRDWPIWFGVCTGKQLHGRRLSTKTSLGAFGVGTGYVAFELLLRELVLFSHFPLRIGNILFYLYELIFVTKHLSLFMLWPYEVINEPDEPDENQISDIL